MFIIIEIIIARETMIGVTRDEALFSIRNCLTLSTKAPYDIRAKNYKSTPTTCFNLLLPLATRSADPSVVSLPPWQSNSKARSMRYMASATSKAGRPLQ